MLSQPTSDWTAASRHHLALRPEKRWWQTSDVYKCADNSIYPTTEQQLCNYGHSCTIVIFTYFTTEDFTKTESMKITITMFKAKLQNYVHNKNTTSLNEVHQNYANVNGCIQIIHNFNVNRQSLWVILWSAVVILIVNARDSTTTTIRFY